MAQQEEAIIEEQQETFIGLFCGSFTSFESLDFTEFNLKFVEVDSENFQDFMDKVSDTSLILNQVLTEFKKGKTSVEKLHALIPISETELITQLDLWKVRNFLLLVFPSDIFLKYLIGFRVKEEGLDFFMHDKYSQQKIDPSEPYKNFIYIETDLIDNINKFIKLFFKRYEHISYLIPAFKSYLSSYFQNSSDMEFLSLCISLETIVEAKTELTYRIRRNIAVLLSLDKTSGKRIFKNIGLIYSLRSGIAHSGKYDERKIDEYLHYLRYLVSILIIELIKLNNNSLTALNDELTSKGYGEIYSKGEEFSDFELNTKVATEVLNRTLTR
jgi:hypothetical protein